LFFSRMQDMFISHSNVGLLHALQRRNASVLCWRQSGLRRVACGCGWHVGSVARLHSACPSLYLR
jgi:hypothetical protein